MYPIPPNATRIRYLEATALSTSSGPYINTGFIPTSYSRFEIEYANVGNPSSQEVMNGIAGGAGGSNNSRFAIGSSVNGGGSTYFGVVQSNIDSVQRVYSQTKIFQFIYLNGTSATYGTDSVTRTVSINPYENTTAPVILFGRYGGNGVFFPGATTQRIYRCKLWRDSSTLAHDFVPLRIGSVGYLFDRVSGQLFGNAGTGDFVLGPDTFQQGVIPTRMMVAGKHNSMVRLSSCWANGEVDLPVDFIPSDGVTVEDTIRSTGGYSGSSDRAIFGVSISSVVWQDIFCRKNGAGYCFVCGGPFGEFRWNGVSTVNDGQFHTFRSGPWTTSYSTSMTEYKVDNVSRSGVWNGKRSRTMPQNRICLFACRTYNGGLTFKCSEKSHCELKRLRFEKNGVTLASYVPVRMNGIVGVYNEISKRVFFPVSGTLGGE